MKRILVFCVLVLSGCSSLPSGMSRSGDYHTIRTPVQCVPYARQASGIEIYGDAHTWWGQARGTYKRGARPRVGAVMVLSKTARLRHGHLAVVRRVVNPRLIEVEHTNWGGDRKTRSVVYKRMKVRDSSARGDWSRARFWHYPSGTYGRHYAVSGFVYR